MRAFAETLQAILRLWREDKVDFDGTFVKLRGATCTPKPLSPPPIWTGTHGPRGLEVAARLADVANFNQGLDEFVRLSGVLGDACARVGRTIETSVFRLADLTGGAALRSFIEALGAPAEAADAVAADHFIGTVEEVVPKVQAFVDAGCRHVVIMPLDFPASTTTAERFLREVAPAVTEAR